MDRLIEVAFAFFFVSIGFSVVERVWPAVQGKKFFRRGFFVDLGYWFYTALITRSTARLTGILIVLILFVLLGKGQSSEEIQSLVFHGFGPVAAQSHWLMAVEVLIISDCVGYWIHRLFHSKLLWKFHAVHHSSEELDWLSSVRLHPVNDIINRVSVIVPLGLIGFPLTILGGVTVFLTLYALLLHANVTWDFGGLRTVFCSPKFHRWHHTSEEEGRDKNFSGYFPLWDILFGTYYMPSDKQPERFGAGPGVPQSFIAQLLYPFRK